MGRKWKPLKNSLKIVYTSRHYISGCHREKYKLKPNGCCVCESLCIDIFFFKSQYLLKDERIKKYKSKFSLEGRIRKYISSQSEHVKLFWFHFIFRQYFITNQIVLDEKKPIASMKKRLVKLVLVSHLIVKIRIHNFGISCWMRRVGSHFFEGLSKMFEKIKIWMRHKNRYLSQCGLLWY